MDYTIHGILQARILEWVAYPFSSGSSRPRNWTGVSCIAGGFFTSWAIREAPSGPYQFHPREISRTLLPSDSQVLPQSFISGPWKALSFHMSSVSGFCPCPSPSRLWARGRQRPFRHLQHHTRPPGHLEQGEWLLSDEVGRFGKPFLDFDQLSLELNASNRRSS